MLNFKKKWNKNIKTIYFTSRKFIQIGQFYEQTTVQKTWTKLFRASSFDNQKISQSISGRIHTVWYSFLYLAPKRN